MEIKLGSQAQKDLEYWKRTGNQRILKSIRALTESVIKTPFSGIGSPEPLKHNLAGEVVGKDYKSRQVYLRN